MVSRLEEMSCRDSALEEQLVSLLLLLGGFGFPSVLLETKPKSLLSFGVWRGVLQTEARLVFLLMMGVKAL